MRLWWLLACLAISGNLSAQKVEDYLLDAAEVRKVRVDASLFGEVAVYNSPDQSIRLEFTSRGPYKDDALVTFEQEQGELIIGYALAPDHYLENDKITALKTFEISISLGLPAGRSLQIEGESGRVECRGNFGTLDIKTTSGDCFLNVRSTYTHVDSISGEIQLKVQDGQVDAGSTYGLVSIDSIPESGSYYKLSSLRGNVVVEHLK